MKFKSINGNLAVTEDGDMVHLTYGVRNGKPFIRTTPIEVNPPKEEKETKEVNGLIDPHKLFTDFFEWTIDPESRQLSYWRF